MLNRVLLIGILFCLGCLPLVSYAQATVVWPGDINNNGTVNSSDVLYWGLAYGAQGPERDNNGTEWMPMVVDSFWTQAFPDGTNYVFADCNGDGIVDDDDLAVIAKNFRQQQGMVEDDESANGIPGIDPKLQLVPQVNTAVPGDAVQIALDLGTADIPVNDFYGIALQFSYTSDLVEDKTNDDPDLPDDDDDDDPDDDDDDDDDDDPDDDDDDDPGIGGEFEWRSSTSKDSITFELGDSSWVQMMQTGTTRSLLITDRNTGEAELAITRIDQQPIDEGAGRLGLFTVVIEDIVVGLEESQPLEFTIDKVRAIDTTLTVTAIAPDTTAITIIPDSIVTSTTSKLKSHDPIELYPNPITDYTFIYSEEAIEHVALYNMAGQRITVQAERLGNHQYQLRFPATLHGVFVLRVAHAGGLTTRKVTIISQ